MIILLRGPPIYSVFTYPTWNSVGLHYPQNINLLCVHTSHLKFYQFALSAAHHIVANNAATTNPSESTNTHCYVLHQTFAAWMLSFQVNILVCVCLKCACVYYYLVTCECIGFIIIMQKKYAEARQYYEKALSLDPGNKLVTENLAKLDRIHKPS